MPRGNARQESRDIQKAIDKEQKRNRGAISCAECRRLKLKCDKTVPCSSCKRRGCSAICPNGDLATGQGTRFVLADTETLHQKISQMSDRIRQLEDALAILQSIVSPGEQHPLLSRDLVAVKSIVDLHVAKDDDKASRRCEKANEDSQYIQAFGTLALRNDGAATFYGPSAGPESLLVGERAEPALPPLQERLLHDLPEAVRNLSRSFPLVPAFDNIVDLDYLMQNHLPPWQRAHQLSELYLSKVAWLLNAMTKQQLLEVSLPMWYDEAADLIPPGSVATATVSGSLDSPNKNPHELALLFIMLCVGALHDDTLPSGPDNEEAKVYFELTKAALNLEPVMESTPSVASVQTLTIMAVYYGMCGKENSIECTWNALSVAAKLAQSIVDRDCARWHLPSFEVQKRRALFWELFMLDCLQSLATGRLVTFHLAYVDCELPNDPDSTLDEDGNVIPGFAAWKSRFAYEYLAAVVQNMQTAKAPSYSVIIELDRKVRDMELPRYPKHSPQASMAMNFRCLLLLYIHRCFFAEAVSNSPANPMNSPYAPSFLAGYRNACECLGNLRSQFDLFPAEVARLWALWAHAFSSAVMLSSVVTHATGQGMRSKVTGIALAELRRAVHLFQGASEYGSRAGKFLPILQRLLQKAEQAYKTSTPAVTRRKDLFAPSTHSEPKDELYIFSGQINKVFMRTRMQPGPSQAGSCRPAGAAVSDTDPSDPASSVGTSGREIVDFPNLHPVLLDQWVNFDVHLNCQILGAQRENYYPEPDTDVLLSDPQLGIMATERHQQQTSLAQVPGIMPQADSTTTIPERLRAWCRESYRDTQTSHPETRVSVQYFTNEHTRFQFGDHGLLATSERSQFQQYQTDVSQQPHFQSVPHPELHTIHSHHHQLESHFGLQYSHHYTTPTLPHHPSPPHDAQSESSVSHLHPSRQHWDGSQIWDSSQQPLPPPAHHTFAQSTSIDQATDFALQHHLQETWQSFPIYVGSPKQPPL
ncbi:fungal-specific transcription factor domain-containing protein [Scleroderma yunnanense]